MRLEVDRSSVIRAREAAITAALRAQVQAVRHATRGLEKDLESQTRRAAKGQAWRAWKSATYPRRDIGAYAPQGEVFANGGARSKGMLAYFSVPGINRAKHGKYLAVPMNAALRLIKGRRRSFRAQQIDVRGFEAMTGIHLRPLFRAGQTPLLVADGYKVGGVFHQITEQAAQAKRAGRQRVKSVTVPMFALIATQNHANRVSIAPALSRARDDMVTNFAVRLRAARAALDN